jgi:predicted CopG family antitoxin
MPNITLSISEETYRKMKMLSEIRWSEIARKAREERIKDLSILNKLASKSKITDKDIEEISKKIKRAAAIRFDEDCNRHK